VGLIITRRVVKSLSSAFSTVHMTRETCIRVRPATQIPTGHLMSTMWTCLTLLRLWSLDCDGEEEDECNSDPDYIDSSYERWLKTSVQSTSKKRHKAGGANAKSGLCRPSSSATEEVKTPDRKNDVPALSHDVMSSPESQYLVTPTVSPRHTSGQEC
jgi:hypothetical protein